MGFDSKTQAARPKISKVLFCLLSPVLHIYYVSNKQPSHLAHTV